MRTARQPRHLRSLPRRLHLRSAVMVAVSLAIALVGGLWAQSSASATATATSGKTQVVRIEIDVPALGADNLCNGDTVNLHGTATITTRTTPMSGGRYQVQSVYSARGLTGERVLPLPAYGYVGDQVDDTYSYTAPPNTTVRMIHYVKLIPQVKAPAMWLVVVTREVITPDGTIPTPERAYLTCTKPSSHECHS